MAAELHVFYALELNLSGPSALLTEPFIAADEVCGAIQEVMAPYWERLPLVRSITHYLRKQTSSVTRWTDRHGVQFVTCHSTFSYALSMNYEFSIPTIRTNRMRYSLSIYFNN